MVLALHARSQMFGLPFHIAKGMERNTRRQASFVSDVLDTSFNKATHMLVLKVDRTADPETAAEVLRHVHSSLVPALSVLRLSNGTSYEKLRTTQASEEGTGFIVITGHSTGSCLLDWKWTEAPFYTTQALFMFVITEPVPGSSDSMGAVLKDCWEEVNILNLAIIYVSSDKKGCINCTSMHQICSLQYNPFIFNDTLKTICDNQERHHSNMYDDKLRDTHKTLIGVNHFTSHSFLNIETLDDGNYLFGGPDGLLVQMIVEKMNSVIDYLGNYNVSEMNTKKLSRVFIGHGVILLPSYRNKFGHPHDIECMTAVVPKADQIPEYMNFLLPFTWETWSAYLLSMTIYAVLWKCATSIESNGESDNTIVETLRLFISGATQRQTVSTSQKIFFLMGIIINVIFGNAYQGSLTSYITVRHYYPDMKNLHEMFKSDIKISTFVDLELVNTFMDEFDFDDEVLNALSRYVTIQNDSDAVDMAAFHRNVSRIVSRPTAMHEASKPKYFKDGYPLLHVIDECYCTSLFGFSAVAFNNPFLARFISIQNDIIDGGFFNKWVNDFKSQSASIENTISRVTEPKTINLNHLILPYILLSIGLGLSMIIFVLEIMYLYSINMFFEKSGIVFRHLTSLMRHK